VQKKFVSVLLGECLSFWSWLVESAKRDENPFSIVLFWFLIILASPIWVPYVLARSLYYRVFPMPLQEELNNFEN
jgi:hypothetical protein